MRVRLKILSTVAVGVLGLVLAGCNEEARKSDPAAPSTGTVTNAQTAEAPANAAPASPAAPAQAAQNTVPLTPSMAVPTQSAPLPQNAMAIPADRADATPPLAAGELPPIFDQLEKPDYKAAYAAMISGANVDEWIRNGGTASPGKVVTIGGAQYELYSHCKPHDCGDNMMYVAFSRDHAHAWAMLMANGAATVFGNPDADMRAALKAAACGDGQSGAC